MPFKSPEIPSALSTEHQRTPRKPRLTPLLAGVALSFTLTACGNMFPEAPPLPEATGASPSPTGSEIAASADGVLGADGTVTVDTATEWCATIQSDTYAGLSGLFPDSTKTSCLPSTTGSAISGEGGAASDTSRLLTVSASYAALPILAVTAGVECLPTASPTECTSVKDQTLSLFREFAGQTIVFRYKAPEDQLSPALPALRLVADGFQP